MYTIQLFCNLEGFINLTNNLDNNGATYKSFSISEEEAVYEGDTTDHQFLIEIYEYNI